MKYLHVTAFAIFPILALPIVWLSGGQVVYLFSTFNENGIIFFAFLVMAALFLFHTAVLFTFVYFLYKWIKVILVNRNVSLSEHIYANNADLVSTLIVLEVILMTIGLVVYVPGFRDLLAEFGKLI